MADMIVFFVSVFQNMYMYMYIADARLEYSKISKESYKTQAKFSQTKKQLFQAKRKIDDLQEEVEELQKQLENEEMKTKRDSNDDKDDIFTLNEDNLETIELQTEIATLKAQIASKDIVIDELKMENNKWQEAHDSIFERMTEAQTRLAKEIGEFEDAKKFYENKLSILRDKLQDNTIQFWSYEQRINEITKLYEADTNKKLPEWKDQPSINYDTDEHRKSRLSRVSLRIPDDGDKSKRMLARNSMSGWDALSPMNTPLRDVTNINYAHYQADSQRNSVLYADDEDNNGAFGVIRLSILDDDMIGAFGAFGSDTSAADDDDDDDADDDDVNKDTNEEFECEEDDDDANAFGAF